VENEAEWGAYFMNKKAEVEKFLSKHFPDNYLELIEQFTLYYNWLLEENQKINLISRKTDPEDIWTHHFLDSLLSIGCVEYAGKRVLDFGTGGGFPGVPLALIYKNARFTLLDSTKKKIQSVKAGTSSLKLKNCDFLDIRMEDVSANLFGTFDIVVSRSVRMTAEYKRIVFKLLKSNGCIVLYKSQNLDDATLFKKVEICDVSMPLIGERKIVVVRKSDCI
jgi:16S rRNA (guanine527-N7)-methyltransferase